MRWVSYDYSAHGVFAREVLPEDKEFLLTHRETFKRMWHEQTPMYWTRLVVTLRSFVNANIYEEGFEERLSLPRTVFTALLDDCYISICEKFVFGTFGSANSFLSSIMLVVANIGMMYHIGSKSIARDPFYCKFSRDSYRELFGSPAPGKMAPIKAYVLIPVFSRFAAAVVMLLRHWMRARNLCLPDFYEAYRQNPYWPPPLDWCPNDSFADFLADYDWSFPAEDELAVILMNDPNRQKSLQLLTETLHVNSSEYRGSSRSSDEDEDSIGVVSALADIFADLPDWEVGHHEAACLSCHENPMNPVDLVLNEVQQELLREGAGALFWKQERIVCVLKKAENKFQNQVKQQGIKLRTNFKNVPPKKESMKTFKVENTEAREVLCHQTVNSTQVCLPNVAAKVHGEPIPVARRKLANPQPNEINGEEPCRASDAASLHKEKHCAFCGRSDGLKLKRCGLCVQSGFHDPLRYCSKECQVQDWEEKHQYVHQQES